MMAQWLKQSTAATVKLGPFVDETDGKTAETALTISQADIRLSKNGGAYAQTNNAAGATHDEAGEYGIPLDTTDTNTLGRLKVKVHESGALPCWMEFMVVPANVWDSMFGADLLQVDLREENISLISKIDTIDDFLDTEIAAILAAVDTEVAAILADTNELQTDWTDGGRLDLLIDAILADTNELQTDWVNGGRLDLLLDTVVAATAAAAIRSAVGLASANLDTQLTAIDDYLDTEVAAILAAVDTEVAAIKAKTDNLPSDPADASDIAALIGAVDDFVDTEVAAIKAVTDALGATAAARLKLSAETMLPGTVDNTEFSPTTTVFEADDITEATADHFNGRIVIFTSGALQYQATDITDYALSSGRGRFTVTAMTEAPANNDTFIIV